MEDFNICWSNILVAVGELGGVPLHLLHWKRIALLWSQPNFNSVNVFYATIYCVQYALQLTISKYC